ncbi:MAG: type II toxin-antitoxin system Phd/YefM family antitoxin [Melioribacteraceae bacterium]|nr:type II toxin-antitoxin system Phd/YefM family antitoxin [Melioribacteraceae bacterium]
MQKINYQSDIKPLTEFRANAKDFVDQVRESKRPIILTQHGKSSAILIDVAEYQAMVDKIELFQELQIAEQQIVDGKTLTAEQVERRLSQRYNL